MKALILTLKQVKAECLRLLTTLRLDPARMQLISGFIGVYLGLNPTENELFNATIDRMGFSEQEEYMEIRKHRKKCQKVTTRRDGNRINCRNYGINGRTDPTIAISI